MRAGTPEVSHFVVDEHVPVLGKAWIVGNAVSPPIEVDEQAARHVARIPGGGLSGLAKAANAGRRGEPHPTLAPAQSGTRWNIHSLARDPAVLVGEHAVDSLRELVRADPHDAVFDLYAIALERTGRAEDRALP
jgi:hypothetical protein